VVCHVMVQTLLHALGPRVSQQWQRCERSQSYLKLLMYDLQVLEVLAAGVMSNCSICPQLGQGLSPALCVHRSLIEICQGLSPSVHSASMRTK